MKTAFLVFFLSIGWVAVVNAQLLSEQFECDDGSLTTNPDWAGHSGKQGDLLVADGKAILQHGTSTEDVSINFARVNSGIVSATFDIVVDDDKRIRGTDFEYFAHFCTSKGNHFRSRVDVQKSPDMMFDYTLGISSTTGTSEATLCQNFLFGEVVSVTLQFDIAAGIGSLTVEGETIHGTSSALGETINRFALRQSDSSSDERIKVDNLVIEDIQPDE